MSFLPGEWVVHVTPSVYIDRYGWLKFIIFFGTVFRGIAWYQQVLFFDIDNPHYNAVSFDIMVSYFVQTFIFKPGDRKMFRPMITAQMDPPKLCIIREIIIGEEVFAIILIKYYVVSLLNVDTELP